MDCELWTNVSFFEAMCSLTVRAFDFSLSGSLQSFSSSKVWNHEHKIHHLPLTRGSTLGFWRFIDSSVKHSDRWQMVASPSSGTLSLAVLFRPLVFSTGINVTGAITFLNNWIKHDRKQRIGIRVLNGTINFFAWDKAIKVTKGFTEELAILLVWKGWTSMCGSAGGRVINQTIQCLPETHGLCKPYGWG